VLTDANKRAALRQQNSPLLTAFKGPKGEWILFRPVAGHRKPPRHADQAYLSFIQELYADMHPRNPDLLSRRVLHGGRH